VSESSAPADTPTPLALDAAFKAGVEVTAFWWRLALPGDVEDEATVLPGAETVAPPQGERISLEWLALRRKTAKLFRRLRTALGPDPGPVRRALAQRGPVSFGGVTRPSAHEVVEEMLGEFTAGIDRAWVLPFGDVIRPSAYEVVGEVLGASVAHYAQTFGSKWRWTDLLHLLRSEHDSASATLKASAPDYSAYLPLSWFLDTESFRTEAHIHAVLKKNPWIRTHKPRKQRFNIHAGDWGRFKAGLDEAGSKLLDVPSETAEAFIEAVQEQRQRQEAIRRAKGARK
jgi:hypothetical protein